LGTGVNKSDEGIGVGLEYNCNDNLNTSFYDFVVVGKGVSEFQGGFTSGGSESAGNSFTNTTNPNFFHFFNGGEPLTYFFSSMDPNPSTLNLTLNSIAPATATNPHQCAPNLLTDPNDPNDVKFTKNKLSFDSLNNVLDQLIDGASSTNLITEIDETTTSDATALKTNLLQNSPYLSNEAIKIFANRTDIYSNQDVYDVIVQNPEEARRLGTFLLEKEIPFTDAMMTDLSTATLTVSSVRGQQEAEQHLYYKEMINAANAILFDLKANNPIEKFAKVNQWITSKENQLPFYGLIELQIREGNYTAAQSMINTVPLDYDLSVGQQLEYDNFVLLKSHQMDVYGNGATWAALSTEQEDDLIAISNQSELSIGLNEY
jgi:hypothetical protein